MKKGKIIAILSGLLAIGTLSGCNVSDIPGGEITSQNVPSSTTTSKETPSATTTTTSTTTPTTTSTTTSTTSTVEPTTTSIVEPITTSTSENVEPATTPTQASTTTTIATQVTSPVINNFTVNFNDNNIQNQIVEEGSLAVKPNDPSKNGYSFAGWYNGDTLYDFTSPVTSNLSLTAKWNLVDYEIAYELDGGVVPEGVTLPTTYNYETPEYSLPNLTKTDYDFIGWTKDKDNVTAVRDYKESSGHFGNTKFYAVFTPHDYLADQLAIFKYKKEDNGIIIEGLIESPIDSQIEELIIPEGVVSISNNAFASYTKIKKVVLPESLESIGNGAFLYNESLTDINIPSKVKELVNTFYGCTSLETIDISSINILGDFVFESCSSLKNITFSNDIKFVGEYAFAHCTSLKEIEIPGAVGEIHYSAFIDSPIEKATIPANLIAVIRHSSLVNDENKTLKEINIISGDTIGNSTFYGCSNLSKVTISNTVTTISSNAFASCPIETLVASAGACSIICENAETKNNIKSVTVTSGDEILDYTFNTCKKLESVTLANTVTTIGEYAFGKCEALETIDLPDSVTTIKENAFAESSLLSLTLPKNITTISDDAFYFCKNLKKMELPKNLPYFASSYACNINELYYDGTLTDWLSTTNDKNHGDHFHGILLQSKLYLSDENGTVEYNNNKYTLLEDLVIPEGITKIRTDAFFGYKYLKTVTIPSFVTEMGNTAFGMQDIEKMTIENPNITCNNSFYNCNIKEAVVPSSLIGLVGSEGLHKLVITGGTSVDLRKCYSPNLYSLVIPESVTSVTGSVYTRRLAEIYNLSSYNIDITTTDEDMIGYGIIKIHTSLDEPSIVTIDGDYVFAYDGNQGYLLDYYGEEENLTLPTSFNYNNTVVNSYEIFKYAFDSIEATLKIHELTIPSSVTAIGKRAFIRCTNLKKLTINEGVTSIGNHAFSECTYLNTITLPDSLKTIGNYAFSYNPFLFSVTIPENITSFGNSIFFDCYRLREIYDPNGSHHGNYGIDITNTRVKKSDPSILVTEGNYTFYYHNNTGYFLCYTGKLLDSGDDLDITLPESFTYNNTTVSEYEIDSYAFYNQTIKSVILPQSVTKINNHAFNNAKISSITIENKDIDIDCDLFEEYELNTLTMPIEVLSEISDCSRIEHLTLSSGTTFDSNLLSTASRLQTIKIHSGLTDIKANALDGCTELYEIVFEGTTTEWLSITKEDGWKGNATISTITCSDGEVNI